MASARIAHVLRWRSPLASCVPAGRTQTSTRSVSGGEGDSFCGGDESWLAWAFESNSADGPSGRLGERVSSDIVFCSLRCEDAGDNLFGPFPSDLKLRLSGVRVKFNIPIAAVR